MPAMPFRLSSWLFIAVLLCLLNIQNAFSASESSAVQYHWKVLEDTSGKMGIDQIRARDQLFKPVSSNAFGYLQGALWIRIEILRKPEQQSHWWLELQSPMLDFATLYQIDTSGKTVSKTMGDHIPIDDREIDYRNPVFKLDIPANKPYIIYLQLRSKNTLTVSPNFYSYQSLINHIAIEQIFFGSLASVYFALLLNGYFLYRASSDRSYGWFALYSLCNLIVMLGSEGYLYQYLLGNHPELNEAILIASIYFGVPTGGQLLIYYLEIKSRLFRRVVQLDWCVSLLAIISLCMAGQEWIRPIYQGWMLLNMLFGTVFVFTIRHKNKMAMRILVGLLPFWLAVTIRGFRNVALLPSNMFTDDAYYIGMALYVLALNYAVSIKVKALRKAHDHALAEALRLSKKNELELEEQVIQRTMQLQQAVRRVEASLQVERRAQAEQREFFATVSHELRTPLTVIDMTAQNLELDAIEADAETRTRYGKILQATNRLSLLLDRYLNEDSFTLMRRGVQYRHCNLHMMLDDAAHSASILSSSHQFVLQLDQLPESIVCDPDLMLLVLRSLADNAVKYTPAESTILFTGNHVPDHINIVIRDNGPGMNAETLSRVFEPHFRGKNSVGKPGSGLGLMLARKLMENQGGRLEVESTEGKGCTIHLYLPVHELVAETCIA
ncbi:sensor histidine kinase [Aquitalea sp. LB_tupeE]|uniref:sensor histidine kinase n=1 Tax=Aquitalea sp. LB_tupeE TaxID=2748078 RepID=UPI0015C0D6B1|nr:sensor histidine kinase [Aquitalea sp. LB_tupeE]NWK78055.1 sensor histidine kinase [Aquitalea sp. LB_tupeE]